MSTQTRELESANKILAHTFFADWKKFAFAYTERTESDDTTCRDSTGDIELCWMSPRVVKYKGKMCKQNFLTLRLLYPSYVNDKVVFEVELETHVPSKSNQIKAEMQKCSIKLDNETCKSTMLSKVLISLANITRQNKLESKVSHVIVTIFDSIEAGEFKQMKPMYMEIKDND